MTKPRIAVIGTGGTIASIGKGPLDLLDYGANETMLHVDEIIARFPEVHEVADILPIRFEAIPSPNVFFPEWKALVLQIETLAQEHHDLAGIVVTHGTASLEETAYFLNLTLHVDVPPDMTLFAHATAEADGARRAAHAMQIPIYAGLTREQVERVGTTVRDVLEHA